MVFPVIVRRLLNDPISAGNGLSLWDIMAISVENVNAEGAVPLKSVDFGCQVPEAVRHHRLGGRARDGGWTGAGAEGI